MASNKPKTLQVLAGKPMLTNILEQTITIDPDQVIIVHSPEHIDEIKKETKQFQGLLFVEQNKPLGTGHALKKALPIIKRCNNVLVLLGDVPLIKNDTLLQLIKNLSDCDIRVLSSNTAQPTGYGTVSYTHLTLPTTPYV